MKITGVKPFIMWCEGAGRNWLFVKVETDQGIHGWGEGSLVNQTPTIAKAVHMVAEDIIGQEAGDIERLWQVMFLHNRYRGGVIINSALSAIDHISEPEYLSKYAAAKTYIKQRFHPVEEKYLKEFLLV